MLILSVLFAQAAGSAEQAADDHKYLTLYSEFPPFTYYGKQHPEGFMYAVQQALLRRVGVTTRYQYLPIRRYYHSIAREADFTIGLDASAIRETHYKVRTPILTLMLGLFCLKSSPPVSSMSDLSGKKLMKKFGYLYDGKMDKERLLKMGIAVKIVKERKLAFKSLLLGRQDYYLGYKEIVESMMQENMMGKFDFYPLKQLDFYYFIRKLAPEARALHTRMEVAARAMVAEGEVERLIEEQVKRDLFNDRQPKK